MSSAHALRPSQLPAPRATPIPAPLIPRQRSTTARSGPLDTGTKTGAEAAAPVIAQALIEVLTGRRTAAQLRGCATPAVVAAVAARAPGPAPAQRRTVVPLPRVRLCQPRSGVAEVAVVIAGAQRARALAFRLEHHHGRWICTAVAVG